MSDRNENLKPGDIYIDLDTGRRWLVSENQRQTCEEIARTGDKSHGGILIHQPRTQVEREIIENDELQEKTVRALKIALEAIDEAFLRDHYSTFEWSHMRTTLANGILAKMK